MPPEADERAGLRRRLGRQVLTAFEDHDLRLGLACDVVGRARPRDTRPYDDDAVDGVHHSVLRSSSSDCEPLSVPPPPSVPS